MGVRFDEIRIEVDYTADFVGHRTLTLTVPLTMATQDDSLLHAILARKAQDDEARIAAAPAGRNLNSTG